MESIDKGMENKQVWHKTIILLIGLLAAGLTLNLIPAEIAVATGCPLWLDTAGTILCAYLGGYVPAILVGLISNLIKGIGDTTSFYYAVINVMIAVSATFLARRGFLDKIYKAVVFALCIALVGGGIGGIVPWIMSGFPTHGFLVDLGIDIIDKLVTVTIVLIILYFIPADFKRSLEFKVWYQKPLTREEERQVKKTQCRSVSLRTKVLFIIIVALVFMAVSATVISYLIFKNTLIDKYAQSASYLSASAARIIDVESIDEYIDNGESSEEYIQTEEKLSSMKDSTPDVSGLYVYQIKEDGCHVVFDLDSEYRVGSNAGDVIPFEEAFDKYKEALMDGEEIEPVISNAEYGQLLKVFMPVKNDNGECVCYVCSEMNLSTLESEEMSFVGQMIIIFLGFVLLILAVVIFMVDYGIIYPVNSMTVATQDMKFEEGSLAEGVEYLKELDIHTGDEVENLYRHLVMMTENSIHYINEIHEKNETISTMQKSLIMVLADIVESRDQNTGHHIRKTASYVDVILRKMREMGMEEDTITEEYIANVVNSAPLHDIGKIEVPDAILNKPGRLDDVEFDIMKSHVNSGDMIIERVIDDVPNSSYLGIAKELAKYHHEKWNGKGYPLGLKGNEIPLSARVMAVADVFDALVSKRIYKPSMPIEKAFAIIEEDTGTHFDPDVVKAFVAAKDEIREVEERFEREEEEYEKRFHGDDGEEI